LFSRSSALLSKTPSPIYRYNVVTLRLITFSLPRTT
jgi:hypothetical protein